MRILVCDDHAATRECLTELFRHHGYEVASCATAEAALAMLPYVEGVVCDGLSGKWWIVARQMRAFGKPAVIYSADDTTVEQALALGYPARTKPAPVEDLVAALEVRG